MFTTIRSRMILIAVLVLVSVYNLLPRDQTIRVRTATGAMKDTVVTIIPPNKGLDLKGGMHLGLELDESERVSTDRARDIDLALTILRKRIDEFGVAEPLIQKVGDFRIVVELAGIDDPNRAKAIVQQSAFLEFKITDETGALENALPAMDRVIRRLGLDPGGTTSGGRQPSAVQALLGGTDSVTADSTAQDTTGQDTTTVADDLLVGGTLAGLISTSGFVPGEYLVPETAYPRVDSLLRVPDVRRLLPRDLEFRWNFQPTSVGVQSYRFLYVLQKDAIMDGQHLVDAQAGLDQITNGPIVTFELDRTGGRRFGRLTQAHVGDYMAILLDNRVQGQPPVIQSRIDRRGQITLDGRSITEARDLALTLKAGALPVPLKIVEEFQVTASLGEDSKRAGITAGIVGMFLVIFIMIAYYHTAGAVAVFALMFYLLFTMGGLAAINATLTLPGLAGLVLSIGIAVDANVLIFERIREELALGKTVRLAIDEGFAHAMSAIVDSNISTILTAMFLFQFGTGPVKGFAVTLIMGIIASMITAIFVTRTFFMIWLDRKPAMTTLSI
ncbi:MAG: protein translocase subunit SecD [Gemmatimonadales bacterium]